MSDIIYCTLSRQESRCVKYSVVKKSAAKRREWDLANASYDSLLAFIRLGTFLNLHHNKKLQPTL